MSDEDFRILSAFRRAVREILEHKVAELRQREEESIRPKCALEALADPDVWEEDWDADGAADLAREAE